MNCLLIFFLLTSLAIADSSKKRVKRFAPPVQLCRSCDYNDFPCWTHCNPMNMSWSGSCYQCSPGDWKCLKFCRHPPYPIPPYCDSCPQLNYMCMAECVPKPDYPRSCCHECHVADVLCYKTCIYCQPYNPWPCYKCAYDNSQFCKQKCGVRPPCSQCYDWDPDYVRCLRVCIPDHHYKYSPHYGPYDQSYKPQCNVDVWGSWCADSWFQGLSQTERAALLRQVMYRLDYSSPKKSSYDYKNLIYMPPS
ncbi:Ribosomal protein L15 [Trichuris trichiura]|uniref:Ribosomal protein L15 n=1 Tax=Trichuris trichiura TaxID=36087 RepID=A0A077YZY9_TRITR|nr:Ribosomal protein L15 [Trichuris trichiura]